MQSVAAAFTAEEKDTVRKIVQNLQVSWKKQSTIGNRTFTIGVSTIGGNDVIGINPGAVGSPSNYRYFDESAYVIRMGWERGLKIPTGGLTKALGEAMLDNTGGRFTPRYQGGRSELFTAIQPGKPATISAGFNFGGVDQMLPQFAGIIGEQPQVSMRDKLVRLKLQDYVYYFQNKKLDTAVVFTGQRTDQVLTTLLGQLGMSTAQYDLDTGINVIPFGAFDVGISFASAINELVEAENGQFYQDEQGIFKFENRQHWSSSPYNAVQKVITTSMVIDAEITDDSHIVNVVEVKANAFAKQPEQVIFRLNQFDTLQVPANGTASIFVNFDDPVLSMTTPSGGGATSFYLAYANQDGTGTDLTASVSITNVSRFAQSAKIFFRNTSTSDAYVNTLVITGRVARSVAPIYTRATIGHSITAYQEQVLAISNRFIQNQSWAESYANMILNDFASPENLQKIIIRAIPELQMGDLLSWQGRYWRVFDIKNTLDPAVGFIQELMLLQRSITTYFRIGFSTIGGSDQIAP
jgi:hypothetical protein